MNTEDMILEHLRGEAEYNVNDLLRSARNTIVGLREEVSRLGWTVDYERERLETAEARSRW